MIVALAHSTTRVELKLDDLVDDAGSGFEDRAFGGVDDRFRGNCRRVAINIAVFAWCQVMGVCCAACSFSFLVRRRSPTVRDSIFEAAVFAPQSDRQIPGELALCSRLTRIFSDPHVQRNR